MRIDETKFKGAYQRVVFAILETTTGTILTIAPELHLSPAACQLLYTFPGIAC